jgi:hypothetical protein
MLTTTEQTAVGDALGLGVGIGGSVGGLGAGGVGGVGGPGDLVGAASGPHTRQQVLRSNLSYIPPRMRSNQRNRRHKNCSSHNLNWSRANFQKLVAAHIKVSSDYASWISRCWASSGRLHSRLGRHCRGRRCGCSRWYWSIG